MKPAQYRIKFRTDPIYLRFPKIIHATLFITATTHTLHFHHRFIFVLFFPIKLTAKNFAGKYLSKEKETY